MYINDLSYQAHVLEQRCKSGARWFFWIAALSVVTSVMSLAGGNFAFFLSLGSTQVIDGFATGLASELGDGTKLFALFLDLLIAGGFALIGWFAYKRYLWSFVLGLILFTLDALVLLLFQVWLSLIFHALVIYWIFKGFQAGRQLAAVEQQIQSAPPPPPPDFNEAAPALDGASPQ